MLAEGRRRGIPVLVATVPVNVRDWRPNVSLHAADPDSAARAAWQQAFRTGVLALEAGEPPSAIAPLERSTSLDPRYAEGWYRLGQAYLGVGEVGSARKACDEALHRDAYPFRSVFNDVVREVAAAADAPPLDLVGVFLIDELLQLRKTFPGDDYTVVEPSEFISEIPVDVAETMAIGRTFRESFQKALRGLEVGSFGFGSDGKNDLFTYRTGGVKIYKNTVVIVAFN